MNSNELLILNLEEIRRRSIKIWQSIPVDRLDWKPDAEAMSCLETVRHVLESDWAYMQMLQSGGSRDSEDTPFTLRPYTDTAAEIEFAAPFRQELLQLVRSYTAKDLADKKVDRSDRGYIRTFGDFILRIGYHEAVHAGQLLGYLRTMNAPRPVIWD
jgi:uncharacterized damage-inducible protein DinB